MNSLSTAFSRETAEKVYVQNVLEADYAIWAHVLTSGGIMYICGSLAMGSAVVKVIEAGLLRFSEE